MKPKFNLVDFRRKANLGQKVIALFLRSTRAKISMIEIGERTPSYTIVQRLQALESIFEIEGPTTVEGRIEIMNFERMAR